MKQNLHPSWHDDCVVTCTCGNQFTTGSSLKSIHVDICSNCHPFFTGEMKFVDRQGRVDKFMKKMKIAQTKKQSDAQAKKKKKAKKQEDDSKSYQEILREQKQAVKAANKTKSTEDKK
jgi:large subunit ribosomal protein L31